MSGIKIDNQLALPQDYLSPSDIKSTTIKPKESKDTLNLGELKQSSDKINDFYKSSIYQSKVDTISKAILEQRYEINMNFLVDQLISEDLFAEFI